MKNLLTLMLVIIVIIGTQISCKNTNNTAEQKTTNSVNKVDTASAKEMKGLRSDCQAVVNKLNRDLISQDSISVNDNIRYFFLLSEGNKSLKIRGRDVNTGKDIRSIEFHYTESTKTYDPPEKRELSVEECEDFRAAMLAYFSAPKELK